MGNTKSKQVFHDKLIVEMNALSNTVTNIKDLHVSKEALCESFTYVLEKNLRKYQKSYLEEFHDNIVVIPRPKPKLLKEDICNSISKHYTRLLVLVQATYKIIDVEHNGDNSIAGICHRNINQIDELIEVKYCESKQYHNNVFAAKTPTSKSIKIARKLDLSQLSGFSTLINDVLSKDETRVFRNLIGSLLLDKRIKLNEADKLIMKKFDAFDNEISNMNDDLKQKGGNQLLFEVSENNPIFSTDTCYIKKKYILPKSKIILKKLQKQEADFLDIMGILNGLLGDMVIKNATDGSLELRLMTEKQLAVLENNVKKTLMIFYLQSIVNYNVILKSAEKLQKFNSSI
jgi:hypothetical protein